MSVSRRRQLRLWPVLWGVGVLAAGLWWSRTEAGDVSAELDRPAIDAAIGRGVEWLVTRQQPDGSWRSATYTQLQAGPAATGLAVAALASVASDELDRSGSETSARRAIDAALPCLLGNLSPDGAIRAPGDASEYPTYATALALIALQRLPKAVRARYADEMQRMQGYLAAAQVSGPLRNGLATAEDVGGWGLVGGAVADPSSFRTSNLSTTRFALEALAPVADRYVATFELAEQFLARRQNGDGGFAFLSDPLDQLNKAGAIEPALAGDPFAARSYGTATADGLLAMRAAGVPPDDSRVAAAIDWLGRRPQVDAVPGFPADEVSQTASEGLFYYYAAALAQALVRCPEAPSAVQAPALAAELMDRQRPDGSWANRISTMREDDPLTATCLALEALVALRSLQNSD
ncbi:MAG: terpene cyclase/mutase family protein [Planctomycetaceae bacterium]|nr:terpene cyclase/mutase family protein [Planctomycetaceae bacterium]